MKLENKVLSTYVIFIFLFITWGTISIISANRLFSLTSVLYKRPLPITRNAYLADKAILESNSNFNRIILKKGNDFSEEEAEIREQDKIIERTMQYVYSKSILEKGKQLAIKARNEIIEWQNFRNQIILERKQQKIFSEQALEKILQNQYFRDVNATLGEIINYAADRSNEYYYDSLTIVRKIFIFNISMIILMTLSGIISFYEVYKAIKKRKNHKFIA